MKKWLQFKFAFLIFLVILAAAALVGGDFYYSVYSFVREHLNGIPGYEEVLSSMNQLLYSQIVVLLVTAAGLALIASYKIMASGYKFEKNPDKLKKRAWSLAEKLQEVKADIADPEKKEEIEEIQQSLRKIDSDWKTEM